MAHIVEKKYIQKVLSLDLPQSFPSFPGRQALSLKRKFILLIALNLLFSGCVLPTSYRVNPEVYLEKQKLKSVVFLPPKVEVFEIDAGGVKEKVEEWSVQARENLLKAIEEESHARSGVVIDPVSFEELPEEEKTRLTNLIEDTQALFEAVQISIALHTYLDNPNYKFEEKKTNFDYSLGKEVSPLGRDESQALLFITASDYEWTGGRQALQALAVVAAIAAAVVTRVYINPTMEGNAFLSAVLVDSKSGDILWYNSIGRGAGAHLRELESTRELVEDLFEGFPLGEKKIKPVEEQ